MEYICIWSLKIFRNYLGPFNKLHHHLDFAQFIEVEVPDKALKEDSQL